MIDLEKGLRRLGYPEFRPGQREAIETLLAHCRLLLVAPTGGGKSLIYQLPASLLPGTSLVISPLISLGKVGTFSLIPSKKHRAEVLNRAGKELVGRDGIEPPTPGFSVLCSTN